MMFVGHRFRLAVLTVALAMAWTSTDAPARAADSQPQMPQGAPPETTVAPAGPLTSAPLPVVPTETSAAHSTGAADPLWGLTTEGDVRDRQQRLTFNGYGEIHANMVEGPNQDKVDLHRIVLGAQYDFTSWLTFAAEVELEHAFVGEEAGGELLIEQAYVEYEVCDWLRLRAGRILVPLGIINPKHEPTSFNGVERPSFERYIIPSTWFAEGIGVRGWLLPSVTYEAYVMTSLNGSKFDALDGIREGRIEETSSLHQPAFAGRIDYFPFAVAPAPGQQFLRLGTSTFLGGLDNGNNGEDPGLNGTISIISADFEYRLWRVDFRGEFAYESIPNAAQIGNGTAQGILGWYLETALHVLPDHWKCGRLEKADALIFTRFDDYNTQYRMPVGVARDDAGVRREWTLGCGFLPVPNFVVKADYQIPQDATGNRLPQRFNVGLGWQF